MSILSLIVLLLAIPIGYWIAWLAKDELVQGRKWFWVLIVASFITAGVFFYLRQNYIVLTAAFIAIVSGISLMKSYNAES